MKKLLSLLGVALIASSSASVVMSYAYSSNQDSSINNEAKFYSLVSAEAFKSAVLADQNFSIYGKSANTGLDINWTSNYFGSKSVKKEFGTTLFNPKQGANTTDDSVVNELYKTVFGPGQKGYNYTIMNSFGNGTEAYKNLGADSQLRKVIDAMHASDPTKTNLNNLVAQPDAATSSMLGGISGIANVIFKNGFVPSLGSTAAGTLSSSSIRSNIFAHDDNGNIIGDDDKIMGIFKTLNNVFTNNKDSINKLTDALSQRTIAKNANASKTLTIGDQLTNGIADLMQALIYFLSPSVAGNYYVYTKTNESNSYTSKEATDIASAFWNLIINKKTDGLTKRDYTKLGDISDPQFKDQYDDVFSQGANAMTFLVSFLHYLKAYRDASYFNKDNNGKSSLNNPRVLSGLYDHLFSSTADNNTVIETILKQGYFPSHQDKDEKDENDIYWFKDEKGNPESTKISLQNLMANLQYYLVPTPNARDGYNTLALFNMLLGDPEKNPIPSILISQSLGTIVKGMLSSLKSKIDSVLGVIKTVIPNIYEVIDQILSETPTFFNNVLSWFTSDGNSHNEIGSDISALSSIILFITSSPLLQGLDGYQQYIKIAHIVTNRLNQTQFAKTPWTSIYSGNFIGKAGEALTDIYRQVLAGTGEVDPNTKKRSSEIYFELGKLLTSFGSISSLINMHFQTMVDAINASGISSTPLAIKDWLYKGRDWSVAKIINQLASIYETNAYTSAQDNLGYNLNGGTIEDLVSSLEPNLSDDGKTSDKSKVIFEQKQNNKVEVVSPIMPLYYILKYFSPVPVKTLDGDDSLGTYTIKLPDPLNNKASVDEKPSNLDAEKPADETNSNISISSAVADRTGKVITVKLDNKLISDLATNDVTLDGATGTPDADSIKKGSDTIKINVNPAMTQNTKATVSIKGLKDADSPTVVDVSSIFIYSVDLLKADSSNVKVDTNAIALALGLDNANSGGTSFLTGSIFDGLYRLYGNEVSDSQGMDQGFKSIFTLFGDFASFTSQSILQITNDLYFKYFDPKNWKVSNIRQSGLDSSTARQDLKYDLSFYNPDLKESFIYHIEMTRDPDNYGNYTGTNSHVGWVLQKITRQ